MKTSTYWIGLFAALVIGSGCNTGGEASKDTKESVKAAPDSKAAAAPAGNEKKAEKAEEKTKPQAEAPAKAGGIWVDPAKLEVIEGRALLDKETNFLKISGEVKNNSGQWIESVRINVHLLDSSGKEIIPDAITIAVAEDNNDEKVDNVYAERHYVPPGESAVFTYMRDAAKIKGGYASHKLAARARIADKPPTVAIEDLVTKEEDGGKVTTGKIVNKGAVPCRSPKAALGYMTAGGKVWEAKSEEPEELFQKMLEPGKSVAFKLKSADAGKDVVDVKAWADCSEPL